MHSRNLFGNPPDNAPAPSPDRIVSGYVLCLGCALCSGCASCPGCASRATATRSAEPPKTGRLSESVAGRDRRSSFPRAAMPNRQCLATPAHTHQQGGYIRRGGTTQQPVWKRPYGKGKQGKHIRPAGRLCVPPAFSGTVQAHTRRRRPRRSLRVDLPAENMSGFPTD